MNRPEKVRAATGSEDEGRPHGGCRRQIERPVTVGEDEGFEIPLIGCRIQVSPVEKRERQIHLAVDDLERPVAKAPVEARPQNGMAAKERRECVFERFAVDSLVQRDDRMEAIDRAVRIGERMDDHARLTGRHGLDGLEIRMALGEALDGSRLQIGEREIGLDPERRVEAAGAKADLGEGEAEDLQHLGRALGHFVKGESKAVRRRQHFHMGFAALEDRCDRRRSAPAIRALGCGDEAQGESRCTRPVMALVGTAPEGGLGGAKIAEWIAAGGRKSQHALAPSTVRMAETPSACRRDPADRTVIGRAFEGTDGGGGHEVVRRRAQGPGGGRKEVLGDRNAARLVDGGESVRPMRGGWRGKPDRARVLRLQAFEDAPEIGQNRGPASGIDQERMAGERQAGLAVGGLDGAGDDRCAVPFALSGDRRLHQHRPLRGWNDPRGKRRVGGEQFANRSVDCLVGQRGVERLREGSPFGRIEKGKFGAERDRLDAFACRIGPGGEALQVGGLEEIAHCDRKTGGARTGRDLDRRDRIPAELEIVLAAPDLIDGKAEDAGPDRRERLLARRLQRGYLTAGPHVAAVRIGQGASVHLAIGQERDRVQPHDRARQHMARQNAFEVRQKRAGFERPNHPGDDGEAPALARPGQDDRSLDAVEIGDRGLDLGEIDAHAANLHLSVLAAEKGDGAVRLTAAPVAAAEERALAEGVRYEGFGRKVRLAVIAVREIGAADPELTRQPVGHGSMGGVEEIDGTIVERASERGGLERSVRHLGRVGPGDVAGDLRRAIEIDETAAGCGLAEGAHEIGGQRLARRDHMGETGQPRGEIRFKVEHRPQKRRHQDEPADLVAGERVDESRHIAHARLVENQRGHALQKRAEDLPDAIDEAESGLLDHHLARLEGHFPPHPGEAVERPAMERPHTLRPARRAGSIDEIGKAFRREDIGARQPVRCPMGQGIFDREARGRRGRNACLGLVDRQKKRCARILQHRGKPRRGIGRIESEEGRAGLHDGEKRGRRLDGAAGMKRDDGAGRNASGDDRLADGGGHAIEFGEGDAARLVEQGDGLRGAACLPLEERDEGACRGERHGRARRALQQGGFLGIVQETQIAEAISLRHLAEEPCEPCDEGLDLVRLKAPRIILKRKRERVAASFGEKRQRRARLLKAFDAGDETGEAGPARAVAGGHRLAEWRVLDDDEGLRQALTGRDAGEALEIGQAEMAMRLVRRLTLLQRAQERPEFGCLAHLCAHRQGVEEHADDRLAAFEIVRPAGDGDIGEDVAGAAIARQENGEGAENERAEGDALGSGLGGKPFEEGPAKKSFRAPHSAGFGARALAERDFGRGIEAGQFAHPMGLSGLDVEIPQPGDIALEAWGRGQVRFAARQPGGIGGKKVVIKERHAPAVDDGVMFQPEQRVTGAAANQRQAHQGRSAKIERGFQIARRDPIESGALIRLAPNVGLVPSEIGAAMDDLERGLPVLPAEARAQNRMALHEIGDRALQRLDVEIGGEVDPRLDEEGAAFGGKQRMEEHARLAEGGVEHGLDIAGLGLEPFEFGLRDLGERHMVEAQGRSRRASPSGLDGFEKRRCRRPGGSGKACEGR